MLVVARNILTTTGFFEKLKIIVFVVFLLLFQSVPIVVPTSEYGKNICI